MKLLDPAAWSMTAHALKRACEMDLDPRTIQLVLQSPEEIVQPGPGSKYRHHDRVRYQRGEVCAVVEPHMAHPSIVITFLWRYAEGWAEHADDPGKGREYRPDVDLRSRPGRRVRHA